MYIFALFQQQRNQINDAAPTTMSDKQDAVGRNKEHACHVTWASLFVLAKKVENGNWDY